MPTKHFISLQNASELTARFQKMKTEVLADGYKEILCNCETFDREAFDKVLAKDGCTGIRIYFGMDAINQLRLVVVGVNAQDQDMISSQSSSLTEDDDIFDNGRRCPDECPPDSPLNS